MQSLESVFFHVSFSNEDISKNIKYFKFSFDAKRIQFQIIYSNLHTRVLFQYYWSNMKTEICSFFRFVTQYIYINKSVIRCV